MTRPLHACLELQRRQSFTDQGVVRDRERATAYTCHARRCEDHITRPQARSVNDRFWHLADMPGRPIDVRSRG
jgi:hypothetical protein